LSIIIKGPKNVMYHPSLETKVTSNDGKRMVAVWSGVWYRFQILTAASVAY
jgi:hypothetical protein